MHSLTGDRFLKRFFGNRSHRHTVNPAGEEKSLPENGAVKTADPVCPPKEGLPIQETTLEMQNAGETNLTKNPHA